MVFTEHKLKEELSLKRIMDSITQRKDLLTNRLVEATVGQAEMI